MATNPYALAADLLLPAEALAELQDADVTRALTAAQSEADTYLASRYTLPLVEPVSGWPAALKNAVAQIATYRAMLIRGYAPMAGQNDSFRQQYKHAIAFLKDVAAGNATLQVMGSSSDAVSQEGGGPSSAHFVLQPDDGSGLGYSEEEEFWHDSPSVQGGGGFTGSRRRGW